MESDFNNSGSAETRGCADENSSIYSMNFLDLLYIKDVL